MSSKIKIIKLLLGDKQSLLRKSQANNKQGVCPSNINETFIQIEGVHGIRSKVTFDVTSNSPCVSQENTRQFGRRI